MNFSARSEEHTSELQSRQYLHSFLTPRSSDLGFVSLAQRVVEGGVEIARSGGALFLVIFERVAAPPAGAVARAVVDEPIRRHDVVIARRAVPPVHELQR